MHFIDMISKMFALQITQTSKLGTSVHQHLVTQLLQHSSITSEVLPSYQSISDLLQSPFVMHNTEY